MFVEPSSQQSDTPVPILIGRRIRARREELGWRNTRDASVFMKMYGGPPSDVTERDGRMTRLKVEPWQNINMYEEA
jgi:hypothetical protein